VICFFIEQKGRQKAILPSSHLAAQIASHADPSLSTDELLEFFSMILKDTCFTKGKHLIYSNYEHGHT
jgi:hypothetical protein